jgi:hypothetical protein
MEGSPRQARTRVKRVSLVRAVAMAIAVGACDALGVVMTIGIAAWKTGASTSVDPGPSGMSVGVSSRGAVRRHGLVEDERPVRPARLMSSLAESHRQRGLLLPGEMNSPFLRPVRWQRRAAADKGARPPAARGFCGRGPRHNSVPTLQQGHKGTEGKYQNKK